MHRSRPVAVTGQHSHTSIHMISMVHVENLALLDISFAFASPFLWRKCPWTDKSQICFFVALRRRPLLFSISLSLSLPLSFSFSRCCPLTNDVLQFFAIVSIHTFCLSCWRDMFCSSAAYVLIFFVIAAAHALCISIWPYHVLWFFPSVLLCVLFVHIVICHCVFLMTFVCLLLVAHKTLAPYELCGSLLRSHRATIRTQTNIAKNDCSVGFVAGLFSSLSLSDFAFFLFVFFFFC